MLTIQPNLSQRFHSQPMFKGKYDDAEDVEYMETEIENDQFTNSNPRNLPVLASTYNTDEDPIEPPEESLSAIKEDLDDAVTGIKKIGENMPKPIKTTMNGLCLLGGGAAIAVGTKLGWNEAGNVFSKVWNNPGVIKFRKNIGKFGKKITKGLIDLKETKFCKSITNKFSEWGKSFADSKFGGKVCNFFKKINESKPVVAVKNFFGKAKKANASQISDTTGDVVAFSTGASTTVAGAIPQKKKSDKAETKTDGNEEVADIENEGDDNDIVD